MLNPLNTPEQQIMTGVIPGPPGNISERMFMWVRDRLHPIIRAGEFTGHPVRNLRRLAVALTFGSKRKMGESGKGWICVKYTQRQ